MHSLPRQLDRRHLPFVPVGLIKVKESQLHRMSTDDFFIETDPEPRTLKKGEVTIDGLEAT